MHITKGMPGLEDGFDAGAGVKDLLIYGVSVALLVAGLSALALWYTGHEHHAVGPHASKMHATHPDMTAAVQGDAATTGGSTQH